MYAVAAVCHALTQILSVLFQLSAMRARLSPEVGAAVGAKVRAGPGAAVRAARVGPSSNFIVE